MSLTSGRRALVALAQVPNGISGFMLRATPGITYCGVFCLLCFVPALRCLCTVFGPLCPCTVFGILATIAACLYPPPHALLCLVCESVDDCR